MNRVNIINTFKNEFSEFENLKIIEDHDSITFTFNTIDNIYCCWKIRDSDISGLPEVSNLIKSAKTRTEKRLKEQRQNAES